MDMQCATSPMPDPLGGSIIEHYDADCPDLMDRWLPVDRWLASRIEAGVLALCSVNDGRAECRTTGHDAAGRAIGGVNVANQDYLSLARHPQVLYGARRAIANVGLHAAGTPLQMGLTSGMIALEAAIADFTACREATVFPSGWAAGYGAIRALVRPEDHVLIDARALGALHEGAMAATPNVHRFPHLSTEGATRWMERLRECRPDVGILVITESLFGLDSDAPDLGALQQQCSRHGATLMVDVSHDLGALGPTGRGALELQGMLGEIDIVVGSFAKVFASNGGFVASNHRALRPALRFGSGPQTSSNALSPVQAATVLAALEVVQSPEGAVRRQRLMHNALTLREAMQGLGLRVIGAPSAVVPVILGSDAWSRRLTAAVLAEGGLVNLLEFPSVPRNACRWRLHLMADHSDADIAEFTTAVHRALSLANDPTWNPVPPL